MGFPICPAPVFYQRDLLPPDSLKQNVKKGMIIEAKICYV